MTSTEGMQRQLSYAEAAYSAGLDGVEKRLAARHDLIDATMPEGDARMAARVVAGNVATEERAALLEFYRARVRQIFTRGEAPLPRAQKGLRP